MFGELTLSSKILKSALAVNLGFTFGIDLYNLTNFYWENLLFGDFVNG
jgi:hypothetical protein